MPLWFFNLFLALLAAAAAAPVTQAAEPWPTTRFKVFVGNPFVGSNAFDELVGFDRGEFEDRIGRPDDEVIEEIERALTEAAGWYRRHGFPPPLIEPLVETKQGPAYQVYVCREEFDQTLLPGLPWGRCNRAGAYLTPCDSDTTRNRVLYVNSEQSLDDDDQLTELGYQTIAHELMHAIVSNTPAGRSNGDCSLSGWISEGIPDAISYDIAGEIWRGRYHEPADSGAVIKRYGYRPYLERLPQSGDVPLPTDPQTRLAATYATSSFWRYLADSSPEKWEVLLTRRPGAAPGLLDVPLPDGRGWEREVSWVDQVVRGKFNLSLGQMYGLFVSSFSHRIAPMRTYARPPTAENHEHWVNLLFGECEEVNISAGNPSQTITVDVNGLASACVWVNPTGAPGAVQISFMAGSDDLSLLQDLSIGRAGTTLLVRGSPIAHTPHGPTQYVASWRDWPQDGTERTLYVITNVANDPTRSRRRTFELTAVFPNNSNSARAAASVPAARVAPPPLRPGYEKHAPSLARQRQATAAMIAEQMNLDKAALNPHVSRSTDISRQVNVHDCREPFRYTVCGPHMTISLSLMPGTWAGPGLSTTQGGLAAQAFGGLQAMAQSNPFDAQTVMQELTARLDRIDGSEVNIAIPLIDYGFTGSFDNAHISVRMSGERIWHAIGPPNINGDTPLTGQVTIEEYTPFVVRGSFVAPLAEIMLSAQQEPVYTPRQTVTGTFTSVAPWQKDERAQILQLDTQEQIADDIANTLGVPPGMVHSLKQQGAIPGGPSPAGGGGAGGGGSGGGAVQSQDCTCECSTRPFADELCELLCEEEFAACDVP